MNAYARYTDGRAATEATTNRANYNAVMFQLLGISSSPWVGINWEHRRILHRALAQERDDNEDSDSEDSDNEDSDSDNEDSDSDSEDSDSDSEDSDSDSDSVNEDNSLIEGNPGGFVRRISFTESEFSLDDDDYDASLRELDVPTDGHQELRQ